MADLDRYSDKNSVTQDNQLIEAGYTLTLNEKRLLALGMSKVDPTRYVPPGELHSFEISVKDWEGVFNEDNPWRTMKRAADGLMSRYVTLHPRTGMVHKINWFDSVQYFEDEARMVVTFSASIHLRLANIYEQFTSYQLREIAPFKSFYTVRLWELLSQFKSTGYCKKSLDDFRFAMDCIHTYPTTKQLKQRVVAPAVKELNKKTEWDIEQRDVKRGRAIVGFEFIVRSKTQDDLFR